MSQENVEIVRRAYQCLNERDAAGLAALCDEDFSMDMTERVFNPDTYRGRAGIARFVSDVNEAWESYHWEVEEAIVAGDQVVAMVHAEGLSRVGGPGVDWHVAWLWKLKDGKVHSLRFHRDRAKALEAAGLSE
jgi:ketosteroid isomerase-like protein